MKTKMLKDVGQDGYYQHDSDPVKPVKIGHLKD